MPGVPWNQKNHGHGASQPTVDGSEILVHVWVTPLKFNSSPPKKGGWKTILSNWEGNFSGAMSNFGGIPLFTKVPFIPDC